MTLSVGCLVVIFIHPHSVANTNCTSLLQASWICEVPQALTGKAINGAYSTITLANKDREIRNKNDGRRDSATLKGNKGFYTPIGNGKIYLRRL